MSDSDERFRTDADTHLSAAMAFVQQVSNRDIQALESLILFGSTVRGEANGLDSDIDFLAVVSDDGERQKVEGELRDIAYDVMLEHGPVVEVHVLTQSTFEQRREHPFIRHIVDEGEVHV